MTDQHPVTPPPELVHQWADMLASGSGQAVFAMAAQWGSDQELEACVNWSIENQHPRWARAVRDARRPKPPSLKEQALMALEDGDIGPGASLTPVEVCIIRRALEQLSDAL